MNRKWLCGYFIILLILNSCGGRSQEIVLVSNKVSEYKIVIPSQPSALEQRAAKVLQNYIQQISGAQLPVVRGDAGAGNAALYLGHTQKGDRMHPGKLAAEAYLLETRGKDLFIMGGSGKGLIYGVYALLENNMGCKKLANVPAFVPSAATIKIPVLHEEVKPQFEYRECYYPASADAEYLEWNRLQKFEDLWGLWGHSYNKLVPPATYFKSHPEYYALVKGVRQPSQLCLGNDEVYKIVVADMKKRISDNPDAIYWSVSQNDDIGYCECDKCKPVNDEQGTPAGSLIKFVNKVAGNFPDKKITTLAYAYTHKAPKSLKPAANVYIFLSNIEAYRDKPLSEEGSAAQFRTDLKGWAALTPNIFVWDYITQFTNYLAPFPNLHTLQPNIQYMKDNGVKGIFAQGSGDTYGEWAELRSYLEAKLMADSKADVKKLTADFMTNYYGPKASKNLLAYINIMQEKMLTSNRKLDIYGNPINEYRSYLTPDLIEQYGTIFDLAEGEVENNPTLQDRVMKARLSLEYTVLQQAKFYGIEKHGIFEKENNGEWVPKGKFRDPKHLRAFIDNCNKAGVKELSEGGLTPDKYAAEWAEILKGGVTPTKAIGATVALQYPFAEDYPAKGNRTLVDGNPGYNDFSFNWLCFYNVPMVATIDLGKLQSIKTIKMHFLDDPRHWIFLPEKIKVEVSDDGVKYRAYDEMTPPANGEHFDVAVKPYAAKGSTNARFIKVTATNLSALPVWRFSATKKPMIACDEVYVQ
ncbi:hypothetical protein CJD36_014035 [Flavipsychrobacter stenotrophus]|uniref:DUF4838 domain-containing protein n=1 Tax=Flavipsychrobacter stenotrophus TaxID=2077091 RepID=A0A2S7SWG7_9BACT|nr:DUF4838 domain-containing protein [Flavipsychrobacter stenotrophus]PQJ11084.1 hypothetical protein CJD36_014035 [Flavipsychrobacter stenotrophus]